MIFIGIISPLEWKLIHENWFLSSPKQNVVIMYTWTERALQERRISFKNLFLEIIFYKLIIQDQNFLQQLKMPTEEKMVDPETAILVSNILKPLAKKLFGPTADYLGDGLKKLTEKRLKNINLIVKNATDKSGSNLDEDGLIPPKVLKGIIGDGSYSENFIEVEYLGGVLASSRSNMNRDDRGNTFISVINSLSSYDLRAHYIFYHAFKNVYNDSGIVLASGAVRKVSECIIPQDVFFVAMDYTDDEDQDLINTSIMTNLARTGLINDNYKHGRLNLDQSIIPNVPSHGMLFSATLFGIELFMRVYNKINVQVSKFLDDEVSFDIDSQILLGNGCMKISR